MFNIGTPINARFFIAKVVDKQDPAMAMRVKIRIVGYHPFSDYDTEDDHARFNIVEDEDLPWAPCVDGTYGGVASLPNELEWVFGCFIDGDDAQIPIVLGMIPGTNLNDMEARTSTTTGGTDTTGTGDGDVTPVTPSTYTGAGRSGLEADPEWVARLEQLKRDHPNLNEDELYQIIDGESGFDPRIRNSAGATGLFQFMPDTARGLGYTTDQIRAMSPAQQLDVYDAYLRSVNYRGGNLGIIQAAPSYYGSSPSTEVYRVGTRAWEQNPGWRGPDGRITVQSINNYYLSR
jgi:hypothetical protein